MKNNYQEIIEIIDKFGEGRIGDVLDEINAENPLDMLDLRTKLIAYWAPFGFTKSLSEILSDEKGYTQDGKFFYSECTGEELSPKATELFQLLKTL